MPSVTPSTWESFLEQYPYSHLLQTRAWGELKSAFGWRAEYVLAGSPGAAGMSGAVGMSGALILFRPLYFGMSLAYIPRGPVGSLQDWERLWPEVDAACLRQRAVFLKVEPDVWQAPGEQHAPPAGFLLSPHSIQPSRTLVIDLQGGEEYWLERMKQKTRYNIRLAEKKGVKVQPSADMETYARLAQTTGERDGFGVHSLAYYQRAYNLFHRTGSCELLMADYQGEPLAGLLVFRRGQRAWYLFGASSDAHRDRMPTYAVQWQALHWAQARGCLEYDLWGVPDVELEELEAGFSQRSDGLWGVYRFKRGFGGQLRRAAGPWDRVYNPLVYRFYRWYVERRLPEGEAR